MKIETYKYPHSSFLSSEKDMGIITDMIMKNNNLKKLLYYTSKDCLKRSDLTEDQTLELFGKNIKIVPKLYVDTSVFSVIVQLLACNPSNIRVIALCDSCVFSINNRL